MYNFLLDINLFLTHFYYYCYYSVTTHVLKFLCQLFFLFFIFSETSDRQFIKVSQHFWNYTYAQVKYTFTLEQLHIVQPSAGDGAKRSINAKKWPKIVILKIIKKANFKRKLVCTHPLWYFKIHLFRQQTNLWVPRTLCTSCVIQFNSKDDKTLKTERIVKSQII